MAIDQATLSELRRLWLETAEAPSAIAARFGLAHQTVVLAARRHGWGARPLIEAPATRSRKGAGRTRANERRTSTQEGGGALRSRRAGGATSSPGSTGRST
jgi:hypothetical protein